MIITILIVQLQANPEFAEKLGNVYPLALAVNVTAIDETGVERLLGVSYFKEDPFVLPKQTGCELTRLKADDHNLYFSSKVSVRVELVPLKHTLNIIGEVRVPPMALGKDLGSLLSFTTQDNNENFTDVKIAIPGEGSSPVHFFAHKAILAARSPVFSKMFEHGLKERTTNSVTISDIDPEVFKELLTYMYTGITPNIKIFASSLLNAAEKYQLDRLKALCEMRLSYDLQVDNAFETLALAHTYSVEQLKKNVIKYILKHHDELRDTKDWEKVHNKCELLEELDTALHGSAANKKKTM